MPQAAPGHAEPAPSGVGSPARRAAVLTLDLAAGILLRLPGLRESTWFDEYFRTRAWLMTGRARELLLYDVHGILYNGLMWF